MRIKIFFILLLAYQYCFSQYYLTGEDPSLIKWKQIKTNNFKVVFPSGFNKNANTFANYIEFVYREYSDDTIKKKSKIPVVLHNQTSYSNGTVVWAPKRMELFTLPSQNMYAQNWMAQLSLHEVRHICQIKSLNLGITKGLGYILGEQAIGAITGLVPRWYYEGDAVFAETYYSYTGRGRLPSFHKSIVAANLENRKRLSYDQAIYGSYKYYSPSVYAYGYHIVNYGLKKYGNELWNKNLNYVGKAPYLLTPFYFSLKNQTGYSKEQFYNRTYDYLDSVWEKSIDKKELHSNEKYVTTKSEFYTSYRYPQFINNSSIVALKEGIDQISEFVLVDLSGNEEVIYKPGLVWDTRFSVNDEKIVWAEQVFDVRWEHRTYTSIKLYDLRTKKIKTILKKGRYFSPSISPDGSKIAVVEANTNGLFSIITIDIKNNLKTIHLTFNDNEVAQTPAWFNNEELIYILLDNSGKRIEKYNFKSKKREVIYNAGFYNISNPSIINGFIIFNFDHGDVHDIYFIDTLKIGVYKYLKSKFGVFNADYNANTNILIYNQYHSQGYRICTQNFDSNKLQKTMPIISNKYKENSTEVIDFKNIKTIKYEVTKYNKLSHLFKIHSWAPFFTDIDQLSDNPFYADIYPGFFIATQNSLGTAYGTAGYAFSRNGNFTQSTFTYKGFYPVFNIDLKKGGQPYTIPGDSITPFKIKPDYTSLDIQTYIPINLSRNKWLRKITPAISYSYSNSHIYNFLKDEWSRNMSYIVYQLNLSQYQLRSSRDLLPPFGQFTSIKYYSSVKNSKKLFPDIFTIKNTLNLPGILKHHHIQLDIDYEAQQISAYQLRSYLEFPRGYNQESTNILFISRINYLFPLFYPDFSLFWLMYIKRIKCKIFYDYGKSKKYNHKNQKYINKIYNSYGIELTSDMHILRIIFPLNIGTRISFSNEFKKPVAEFIFNMNLK